jgi:hypothetical protein
MRTERYPWISFTFAEGQDTTSSEEKKPIFVAAATKMNLPFAKNLVDSLFKWPRSTFIN